MNEHLSSGIMPYVPNTQIFSLGQTKLEDCEIDGLMQTPSCKWLVYNYQGDDYDGYGEAVSFDGYKVYVWNLDHCSCYGPSDESNKQVFDKDFFIHSLEYATGPVKFGDVLEKVKELLDV